MKKLHCNNCVGLCCRPNSTDNQRVIVSDEDVVRMALGPEFFQEHDGKRVMAIVPELIGHTDMDHLVGIDKNMQHIPLQTYKCIMLSDNNMCKIHNNKPAGCNKFDCNPFLMNYELDSNNRTFFLDDHAEKLLSLREKLHISMMT